MIGKRTTKKGKLDPVRWGWKAVSFFDGQEPNVCLPGLSRGGIFRKHLYIKKNIIKRDGLIRLASIAGTVQGSIPALICRRCGHVK